MGQKIRPDSLRLGIVKNWNSRWFVKKDFKDRLSEDVLIRDTIREKIGSAGIESIEIERLSNVCRIIIKVAKPGLVIGRGGKGIELLTKSIESKLKKSWKEKDIAPSISLSLNVEEVKKPEISAPIIAQNIAWDIERRKPFRRTIKKYLDTIMQNKEVYGAKIKLSGRLDGNEIARREQLSKGKLPLQTLRANIDYGEATAFCAYGTVGIKIWVYKGEVFKK